MHHDSVDKSHTRARYDDIRTRTDSTTMCEREREWCFYR